MEASESSTHTIKPRSRTLYFCLFISRSLLPWAERKALKITECKNKTTENPTKVSKEDESLCLALDSLGSKSCSRAFDGGCSGFIAPLAIKLVNFPYPLPLSRGVTLLCRVKVELSLLIRVWSIRERCIGTDAKKESPAIHYYLPRVILWFYKIDTTKWFQDLSSQLYDNLM